MLRNAIVVFVRPPRAMLHRIQLVRGTLEHNTHAVPLGVLTSAWHGQAGPEFGSGVIGKLSGDWAEQTVISFNVGSIIDYSKLQS